MPPAGRSPRAGPQTLTPSRVAELSSATDPTTTGADRYPIDVAVWAGVADAVGDGDDEAPASSVPGADVGLDIVSQVLSGPLSVQPLRSSPIVSLDRNPRGVDAVALDRPEVVVIFGHIAPSKVAAPNPGYNFRIVSRFSDEQLADDVVAARRRLHGDGRRPRDRRQRRLGRHLVGRGRRRHGDRGRRREPDPGGEHAERRVRPGRGARRRPADRRGRRDRHARYRLSRPARHRRGDGDAPRASTASTAADPATSAGDGG